MTSQATPQVTLDVPATKPLPAHQYGLAGRTLAALATPGGAVFVLADRPARSRPSRPTRTSATPA